MYMNFPLSSPSSNSRAESLRPGTDCLFLIDTIAQLGFSPPPPTPPRLTPPVRRRRRPSARPGLCRRLLPIPAAVRRLRTRAPATVPPRPPLPPQGCNGGCGAQARCPGPPRDSGLGPLHSPWPGSLPLAPQSFWVRWNFWIQEFFLFFSYLGI